MCMNQKVTFIFYIPRQIKTRNKNLICFSTPESPFVFLHIFQIELSRKIIDKLLNLSEEIDEESESLFITTLKDVEKK